MPHREQEGTSYFTPGILADSPKAETRDQQDYSTLRTVGNILLEARNGLSKDFNAFDVLKDADPITASVNLLRQVEAKQMAFDILDPVVEAVISAIQKIDANYKQ